MIELFYVDGHLTNLILFPIFTVVLFFIIRFIELVDNYDNIPYITPQLRCKKCNTINGLVTVCKHTRFPMFISMFAAAFNGMMFALMYYVVLPYQRSLPPIEVTGYHTTESIAKAAAESKAIGCEHSCLYQLIILIRWLVESIQGAMIG